MCVRDALQCTIETEYMYVHTVVNILQNIILVLDGSKGKRRYVCRVHSICLRDALRCTIEKEYTYVHTVVHILQNIILDRSKGKRRYVCRYHTMCVRDAEQNTLVCSVVCCHLRIINLIEK